VSISKFHSQKFFVLHASGIMPTLGIGIAIEPYNVELENRIFAVLLLVVRRGD
jgi:hypothetical protein